MIRGLLGYIVSRLVQLFTEPEMNQLVGDIMGRRPAELLQHILVMMLRNLEHEASVTSPPKTLA